MTRFNKKLTTSTLFAILCAGTLTLAPAALAGDKQEAKTSGESSMKHNSMGKDTPDAEKRMMSKDTPHSEKRMNAQDNDESISNDSGDLSSEGGIQGNAGGVADDDLDKDINTAE